MQLNDHTDIGLRLLVTLAGASPTRMPSTELASRHGLSHTHVQKVIQHLQQCGYVATFRGRGGGVQLAKPATEMRIGDVVRSLEPHFDFVACFRDAPSGCALDGGCALTHALIRARSAMFAELDRSTVADIVSASPALGPLLDRAKA